MDNVTFRYKDKEPIIKNLDLRFEKSSFTAVMGPNGSGKTTLGKLLMGILKPQSGRVLIEDRESGKMSLGEIGSKIGYLFQNPEFQIFSTTVFDELSFIPRLNDADEDKIAKEVDGVLDLLNLRDKKESVTFNLSYGEKQRLAIAAVLMNKPSYIILDEPTTGLDVLRREILLLILKELLDEGKGITVITHDEKFVRNFSGKLLKLKKGEVFETVIK